MWDTKVTSSVYSNPIRITVPIRQLIQRRFFRRKYILHKETDQQNTLHNILYKIYIHIQNATRNINLRS